MELIHHIQCERDILKRFLQKQSRLKIASYQKIFQFFKERRSLMNCATQILPGR